MQQGLSELEMFFSHVQICDPTTIRGLTVLPVTTTSDPPLLDYLLLSEALEKQLVTVSEIDGGTVPEIMVTNDAENPVLLVEGEQLIGAKQNRVLNITILVPARTRLGVPVSCVERGRWSYGRGGTHFRASEHTLPREVRREKVRGVTESLWACGQAQSDQGTVWEEIRKASRSVDAASPTEDMAAVYQKLDDTERRERGVTLDEIFARLSPRDGQVGAVVCKDDRILGIECFDHPHTWQLMWKKILRGYALDLSHMEGSPVPVMVSTDRIRATLDQMAQKPRDRRRATGAGDHLLLQADDLEGFALCHDGRLLHVYAYGC